MNPKTILSSIESIERSTDRAAELVKQLLTLSRKQELACAPVDLNMALQQVVKICQNTFDKSIEIKIEYQGEAALCMADQGQIEQVILNLCLNAAHAMTSMRPPEATQGGLLSIRIKTLQIDQAFRVLHPEAIQDVYWVFSVSDTGVGIESKFLNKIFDPFFTTKENGTGLGLAMVYNIVRQHGGFVDVSSERGAGSTFEIYLPVYDGLHDPEMHMEVMEEYPRGFGCILVVDDEDIIRVTAQNILEEGGYSVITATDGEDGVRIFRDNRSQIKGVLLDMVMPRMSGKDAFIEIRKIDPDAVVLVTSGFEQDPRVQDVLALGADDFIKKPYSMMALLRKFQELFETRFAMPSHLDKDCGSSSYL